MVVAEHLAKRIRWPKIKPHTKPMRRLCELVRPDDDPGPYIRFLNEKPLKKDWVNQALDACREVNEMLHGVQRPECPDCGAFLPLHGFCCGKQRADVTPSAEPESTSDPVESGETRGADDPLTENPAERLNLIRAEYGLGGLGGTVAPVAPPVVRDGPEALSGAAKDAPGGAAAPTAAEQEERKLDESVRLARSLVAAGQPPAAVIKALEARHPDPANLRKVLERVRTDLNVDSPAPVCPSPALNGDELVSGGSDGLDGLVGCLSGAASSPVSAS